MIGLSLVHFVQKRTPIAVHTRNQTNWSGTFIRYISRWMRIVVAVCVRCESECVRELSECDVCMVWEWVCVFVSTIFVLSDRVRALGMCVCCESAYVRVRTCLRVCVCALCVCVRACVWERVRTCVCACVCVCERESAYVRVCVRACVRVCVRYECVLALCASMLCFSSYFVIVKMKAI